MLMQYFAYSDFNVFPWAIGFIFLLICVGAMFRNAHAINKNTYVGFYKGKGAAAILLALGSIVFPPLAIVLVVMILTDKGKGNSQSNQLDASQMKKTKLFSSILAGIMYVVGLAVIAVFILIFLAMYQCSKQPKCM
jgi:preprotein translocase subunit SecG